MKSYGSGGTLWVLLEVPPHGSCPPWPETIGRVAEWCGRDAGRRSAGLGSKGATRANSHAVGVRARVWYQQSAGICAEDISCKDLWQWQIIYEDGRHWCFLMWQK